MHNMRPLHILVHEKVVAGIKRGFQGASHNPPTILCGSELFHFQSKIASEWSYKKLKKISGGEPWSPLYFFENRGFQFKEALVISPVGHGYRAW